jgi:hypothetical protein
MNENAQKWINALRSGKYKQARGVLTDRDGGHCCLGVACELAVELGITTRHKYEAGVRYGEDGTSMATPPLEVQEWLGLLDQWGSFRNEEGGFSDALTEMNDNGASFEEIADVIADEPPGLFGRSYHHANF